MYIHIHLVRWKGTGISLVFGNRKNNKFEVDMSFIHQRKTVAFRHKGKIVFSEIGQSESQDQSQTEEKHFTDTSNLGLTLNQFAMYKNLLPKNKPDNQEMIEAYFTSQQK